MPSGSAAAASPAAAEPAEPPRLLPPLRHHHPPLLLLQQRLAGLGLHDRVARRQARRRRTGLAPLPDPPGEPGPGGAEEEEEEAVAAGDEGDLELEEEELLAGEDEEEEEEDPAALLLLSSSSSPSQPLPLLPALGSVLLSPSFDAQEAAAGPLCGADDPQGMMAAMLSQACAGGAAGLNGEQAALLRRKSVNTTECVPVPSSEHVAEIVGRQEDLSSPCRAGRGLTLFRQLSRKWDPGSQRGGERSHVRPSPVRQPLFFLLGLWLPVDGCCSPPRVSLTPSG